MTVIMVLLTFAIFLLIDFVRTPRPEKQVAPGLARSEPLPRIVPEIVAGFKVPGNVRFHPGHTWAQSESPDRVRVGMDDFASKLIGKIDGITLPQRGRWVRQGQKLWTILRDGKSVNMVSPIEGTVTGVNEEVLKNPELARKDPYGEGWLVTVQAPDAKTNFRNLFGGVLARKWTEFSAAQLRQAIPAFAGLAQDGGIAMDDLTAQIPDTDWEKLTSDFFLG